LLTSFCYVRSSDTMTSEASPATTSVAETGRDNVDESLREDDGDPGEVLRIFQHMRGRGRLHRSSVCDGSRLISRLIE